MRGGEGFILVYSVTEKRSFQEMRRFKETVDRVRNYEKVPIVLIGNKSDLERKREVSQQPMQFMKSTQNFMKSTQNFMKSTQN